MRLEWRVLSFAERIITFVSFPQVGKKVISSLLKDKKVGKRGTILHPENIFFLETLERRESINCHTICPQKALCFDKPEKDKENKFSVKNSFFE